MPTEKPFRVLSLDGGGMRGTYTATYLSRVAETFAHRRGVPSIDVGAAFDLIVGTSTGAIIGCALAAGLPLSKVVAMYREHGKAIFPKRLPKGVVGAVFDRWTRRSALESGDAALRKALSDQFKVMTLGQLYEQRKIALAITAIELSQHRSWVFKTPHLPGTNNRDSGYSLVDVCMASTAAPLYRSMAAIDHPDGVGAAGYNVFVDGGLWANNPVLVGLIDALEMAQKDRPIQVFCLGTCPMPAGEQLTKSKVHRTLGEWRFGGYAAALSIDAQEFAYDNMARMISRHLDRPCAIVRFPRDHVPAALMPYLELDDTRDEAIDALVNQARSDANMTNSECNNANSPDGKLICDLFNNAPTDSTDSGENTSVLSQQSSDRLAARTTN
jgi:uncharacterized protein